MSLPETDNLRIARIAEVVNPAELTAGLPITRRAAETTEHTRKAIYDVLDWRDDRLLVITGPCSIHDPAAALEYASHLRRWQGEFGRELLLVMRVYFEKPRTTVGWKGLINDPDLNNTFDINKGLRMARQLLLELNEQGVPAGCEFLDIISPQYFTDLVSWGAIGARTTESQVHRELASGLSCPVGFKNGTNGNLDIAVDGLRAAARPHHFLSLTRDGNSAIYTTTGNQYSHIILRGGREPNYDAASVDEACAKLAAAGQKEHLMIDFSHANSRKNPDTQVLVGEDVAARLAEGERRIFGVMMESHLIGGRQDVAEDGTAATYGQSITDACMDIKQTEHLLKKLADAITRRRRDRDAA